MNAFAQTVFTNWHPMRVIYLVISGMLLAQAWQSHDWPFAIVGGLFLYQSIFNTGCCGMSGAFRANNIANQKSLEETDYTEIK